MASLRPESTGSAAEADQLLVEANGSTRTLILNRPKQLNVLSSTMIKGLLRCFISYEKQDGVKLLIMKGKGRVFCAGGDVTTCLRSIHNEGWKWGVDFFRNMYSLDYIIATYTKPQVSLLTGIVMGGGAGVSLHGRFRVATDETESMLLLLVPDWMVQKCSCGLATHFVRSNRMLLLEESLKKLDTTNTSAVCGIINQFSEKPSLKENSSLNRMKIINKCFSKRTVEEIISALEKVASNMADEWVVVTIQSLKKASPTSLKISLKLIREGRTQTIGECFRREYRVLCHVVQGDFSKDFYEESRSILINKDRNPRMPPRLEQVDDEAVEQYFCRMDDPRCEDLNLPSRCYNGINIESKL